MPRISGFKSETQRERFADAATLYARGGPLARTCGAKLRTGGVCTQLALAGETRCLRHGGPGAARRFRERQRAGLETGAVSPEEWARAEAKRARNALTYAWRKDPRLPGRTIDLGQDEGAFVGSARDHNVDVDSLFPAIADWLRWRWQRTQRDRHDAARWYKVLREELPRQLVAANAAVAWADLGIKDKRRKAARAARVAMRDGDLGRAKAAVEAIRAASSRLWGSEPCVEHTARGGPLTLLPVQPWTPRTAQSGWKRRLLDRKKPQRAQHKPTMPAGRPPRVPDSPDELAALGKILASMEPSTRAMYATIPRHEDQLRFLRDLAGFMNAPNDFAARSRWLCWVRGLASD
jgi:hypothetical protein